MKYFLSQKAAVDQWPEEQRDANMHIGTCGSGLEAGWVSRRTVVTESKCLSFLATQRIHIIDAY